MIENRAQLPTPMNPKDIEKLVDNRMSPQVTQNFIESKTANLNRLIIFREILPSENINKHMRIIREDLASIGLTDDQIQQEIKANPWVAD